MTFDDLLDMVMEVTNLPVRVAASLANEIHEDDKEYTAEGIMYAATKLGLLAEPVLAPPKTFEQAFAEVLTRMYLEPDPAQVIAHVYRECPRMLPKQEGHLGVYPPRIGRAPKESVFYNDEIRAMIEALPEEIRLLIGAVDVYNGTITITLYDEANDVDRHVGPIDLGAFGDDAESFHDAVMELLKRLSRVIAADWN
jgi:hypothetical protein